MQPVVRKASVWAFSALFGCVSLLGQGWHCFVGHAFHACDTHGHAHAHSLAAACHDHEGDHSDCHAHESTEGESPRLAARHDCPLCSFFAQAQWSADAAPDELVQLSCELPRAGELSFAAPHAAVYQSRGPPSVATIG